MSDDKLDLIIHTLGQISGRLVMIEQRIDKIDQRIDKIEQRMDKIEQRMDTLESGQKELNQIVTAICDRQEETDAKLEALSIDVHRLVGDHTKNQSDIARHEKVLGLLSLSTLELKSDIDTLKSAG